MTAPPDVPTGDTLVFLYDVDNTLLDNDRLKSELDARLDRVLGVEASDLFWRIYEEVREEKDVVDIPETVIRFEGECTNPTICSDVRDTIAGVNFRHYLYPGALDALAHTGRFGTNVVVSDGDAVFQRRKIVESGIAAAAGEHVLIYIHKENHVAEIQARFPAGHYLMIDDKPRILKAMPPRFGPRLRTIFICQGKYAHDAEERADLRATLTLASIGDLCAVSAEEFRTGHFRRQGECVDALPDPRD
ncbi:MAG TPA: HAD family hydrolase [Chloroflexia bacterium]|nr:HAD family hydrolase [Chloroflexia bacterium]